MIKLKNNTQRAENAIIWLWIILSISLLSFVGQYYQYDLLQKLNAGVSVSKATASINAIIQGLLGFFHIIVYIIAFIAFLKWFRRAYYNLSQHLRKLEHTDGWVIGSWFIPILNFAMPYQIMKELYKKTQAFLTLINPDTPILNVKLVNWWWTCWILNIINSSVMYIFIGNKSIQGLMNNTIVSMTGSIISIVVFYLTIQVIKHYAKVEPMLLEITHEENPN